MDFPDNNEEKQEEELIKKLEELENRFDKDISKKSVIVRLKDNLKLNGPEKCTKGELISGILELLSWL